MCVTADTWLFFVNLCLFKLIQPITIFNRDLHICFFNILSIYLHARAHDVPRLYRPNTLWRARQDDITLLQRHHPADVAQLSRDPEKHELRVVRLLHLAVYRQPDVSVLRVRDARFGDQVADGHERVEALSDRPREAFFLRFVLHVSRGHVDGEEVACVVQMSRSMLVWRTANEII